MLAAGPHDYLTQECDDQHNCSTVVTDRATGKHRTLPVRMDTDYSAGGSVAPDRASAAVLQQKQGGQTLHLVPLSSGKDRQLDLHGSSGFFDSVLWSPDSRWVFVVADQKLVVVDTKTMQVHKLGVRLPKISQLAIRTQS